MNDGKAKPNFRLASLALAILLSSLGTSIANVGLPSLAEAFDASFEQARWVVLAYLLAITASIVGAGRLGDRLGRRRLLLAGLALFTISSLLCGVAPSLELLIAARALQGLGAAVMMALALALVAENVPQERAGSAMGLLGMMSAAGTALGPMLGGALIAAGGWRGIFLINLPLGLLAMQLASRHLAVDPSRPAASGRCFDLSGTIRLVLALRLGLGSSLLISAVMMASLIVGPFYLSKGLGLSTGATGLVLSVGPVVAAVSGIPAGRLTDRFGAGPIVIAGLAAMAAACVALGMLPPAFGVAGYVLPMAILTAGYALFQTANNKGVMEEAGVDRGLVSGMLNLSRNLGLVAGTSMLGAVFASFAGNIATAAPGAVAAGMHASFAAAALLVSASLGFAILARGPGGGGRMTHLPDAAPQPAMGRV